MSELDQNEAAIEEAAHIMREHAPKTAGEMFAIAQSRAAADKRGAFLDPMGDMSGHGWAVVDAHYTNLNSPAYRVLAGLATHTTTEANRPKWADRRLKVAKVVGTDELAKKRVTCKECAAIVEYVPNEVKSVHGTDYGGGPDGQEWVDCPNCGGRAVIRSW